MKSIIRLLLVVLSLDVHSTQAFIVVATTTATIASLSTSTLVSSTTLVPPFLIHTAAGAIAGSAGALAAYPIDYVKSQLQTERGRAEYTNGWDAAFRIVEQDGPTALYRGAWVNVLGVAPEKTIKLGTNAYVKSILLQGLLAEGRIAGGTTTTANMNPISMTLPLEQQVLAGAVAGMMQVIVTNPLEVVKVKMQTSSMTVNQVMQEIQNPMDLYNGAGACLVRDMVFSAILFPLYEQLKLWLLPVMTTGLMMIAGDSFHAADSSRSAAFWSDLLAGSLAAGPAAILSTPADVIKTRIQQARQRNEANPLKAEETLVGSAEYQDLGFFQVGSTIVSQEGIMVLGSGWLERVVRSTPQFGVTLALFDILNGLAVEYGWVAEGQ